MNRMAMMKAFMAMENSSLRSIIGILTLNPEVMLRFCYFVMDYVTCYRYYYALWYDFCRGHLFFLCYLCLRTSMLFFTVLYDFISYLVILRTDL
jgi:hypothetical protein